MSDKLTERFSIEEQKAKFGENFNADYNSVNIGHFDEMLDRIDCLQNQIETNFISHPIATNYKRISEYLEKIQDNLSIAYAELNEIRKIAKEDTV